jgi:hypothetical protein
LVFVTIARSVAVTLWSRVRKDCSTVAFAIVFQSSVFESIGLLFLLVETSLDQSKDLVSYLASIGADLNSHGIEV